MSRQRAPAVTTEAMSHALHNRKPEAGLTFHNDWGIEYAAWSYRQILVKHDIVQSINRPGQAASRNIQF